MLRVLSGILFLNKSCLTVIIISNSFGLGIGSPILVPRPSSIGHKFRTEVMSDRLVKLQRYGGEGIEIFSVVYVGEISQEHP